MSRKEFMEELENMLDNIQESEKEEALQYYNDYFDEAGTENEDQVIRELGTPAKVAAIIKTSLSENVNESGEFSERGYEDPRFTLNYEVIDSKESSQKANENQRTYTRERKPTKEATGGKVALIVILCIFAIPVGIPLISSIFGLFIGLLGLMIGIFAAIFGLTVALCVGGLVVFLVGLFTVFTSPIAGAFSIGVGLLLLGLGALFILLCIQICTKFIPWFTRTIVDLIRMPLRKRGTF